MYNKLKQKNIGINSKVNLILIAILVLTLTININNAEDCPDLTNWSHGYIEAYLSGSGGDVDVAFFKEEFNQTNQTVVRTPINNTMLIIHAPNSEGAINVHTIMTDGEGNANFNIKEIFDTNCTTVTIVYCYNVTGDIDEKIYHCTGVNLTHERGLGGGLTGSVSSYATLEQVYAASKEVKFCELNNNIDDLFCLPVFLILGLIGGAFYLSGTNPLNFFNLHGLPRYPKGRPYRLRKRRGASFSLSTIAYAALRGVGVGKGVKQNGLKGHFKNEWISTKNLIKGRFVNPIKKPLGNYKSPTEIQNQALERGLNDTNTPQTTRSTVEDNQLALMATGQQNDSISSTGGYVGRLSGTYQKLGVAGALLYIHFAAPLLDSIIPGSSMWLFKNKNKSTNLTNILSGQNGDSIENIEVGGRAGEISYKITYKDKEGNIKSINVNYGDIQQADAMMGANGHIISLFSEVASASEITKMLSNIKDKGRIPPNIRKMLEKIREIQKRSDLTDLEKQRIVAHLLHSENVKIGGVTSMKTGEEILKLISENKNISDTQIINSLYIYSINQLTSRKSFTTTQMNSYMELMPLIIFGNIVNMEQIKLNNKLNKQLEEIQNVETEIAKLEQKRKKGTITEAELKILEKLQNQVLLLRKGFDALSKKREQKLEEGIVEANQTMNKLHQRYGTIIRKPESELTKPEKKIKNDYEKAKERYNEFTGELIAIKEARLDLEGKVSKVKINGEEQRVTLQLATTGSNVANARLNAMQCAYYKYQIDGNAGNFAIFMDNLDWIQLRDLENPTDVYNQYKMTNYIINLQADEKRFLIASRGYNAARIDASMVPLLIGDKEFMDDYNIKFGDINSWIQNYNYDSYEGQTDDWITKQNKELEELGVLQNTQIENYNQTMEDIKIRKERDQESKRLESVLAGDIESAQNAWKEMQNTSQELKAQQQEMQNYIDNPDTNPFNNYLMWNMTNDMQDYYANEYIENFGNAIDLTQDYYSLENQFDPTENPEEFTDMQTHYDKFNAEYDKFMANQQDYDSDAYNAMAAESTLANTEYSIASYEQTRKRKGYTNGTTQYEKDMLERYRNGIKEGFAINDSEGRSKQYTAKSIRNQWSSVEQILMENGGQMDKENKREFNDEYFDKEVNEPKKDWGSETKREQQKEALEGIDKLNEQFERNDILNKIKNNSIANWLLQNKEETQTKSKYNIAQYINDKITDHNKGVYSHPIDLAILNFQQELTKSIHNNDAAAMNRQFKTLDQIRTEEAVLKQIFSNTYYPNEMNRITTRQIVEVPTPTELELTYGSDGDDKDKNKLTKEYRAIYTEYEKLYKTGKATSGDANKYSDKLKEKYQEIIR